MLIQRINRSDPEKVFVVVKNSYTSAITVGMAVVWDSVTDQDGVGVERPATASLNNFAGVVETASIAAGDYGLIQVYGFNSNASGDGTTGAGAGDGLLIANGSHDFILDATEVSGAVGTISPQVVLMEAYTTGAAAATKVFIKAM